MTESTVAIGARFEISARLPQQVFKHSSDLGFLFADSALLTAREGWESLKACAKRFGDCEIHSLVVQDLAKVRGSTTASLSIDVDSPRELFINWLDQEEPGIESPLYVDARVVAVSGSSGQWGLWIDQDWELAVLGAPVQSLRAVVASTQLALGWVAARDVSDLLEPSFHPMPVPSAVVDQLRAAYGRSG